MGSDSGYFGCGSFLSVFRPLLDEGWCEFLLFDVVVWVFLVLSCCVSVVGFLEGTGNCMRRCSQTAEDNEKKSW